MGPRNGRPYINDERPRLIRLSSGRPRSVTSHLEVGQQKQGRCSGKTVGVSLYYPAQRHQCADHEKEAFLSDTELSVQIFHIRSEKSPPGRAKVIPKLQRYFIDCLIAHSPLAHVRRTAGSIASFRTMGWTAHRIALLSCKALARQWPAKEPTSKAGDRPVRPERSGRTSHRTEDGWPQRRGLERCTVATSRVWIS